MASSTLRYLSPPSSPNRRVSDPEPSPLHLLPNARELLRVRYRGASATGRELLRGGSAPGSHTLSVFLIGPRLLIDPLAALDDAGSPEG